jgi:hypothetical protein
MPSLCMDQNETFVGRIRNDIYRENVLHLWVVADNLRVGAATNAVRIAQKWVEMQGESDEFEKLFEHSLEFAFHYYSCRCFWS